MECLTALAVKRKCHPAQIFWEAINYEEKRWHFRKLGVYYAKFCLIADSVNHYVVDCPEFVEDYALDVLAGRATPMRLVNKKRGSKK